VERPAVRVDTDERLTPTGRATTTVPDARTNVDPALESAARAIKQRWDANPELAKLNLRVEPANGRLVFSGSVPSTELWERAKDTAESIVRGIEIENRISIQQK
jgi:osmotically-inducible protein OsmY